MNKNIETVKIKVNNGQELITKAQEYKNSGGEWKLRERYYTGPASDSNTKEYEWGIIIGNDSQEIDIKSVNNNWVEGRKLNNDDSDGSKFLTNVLDMDKVWDDLCQIFPEVAPARQQLDRRGYSLKKIKKEGNDYLLGRYLVAENSWHLTQIVHQWVQENKTVIQQSPNADFNSWVEIIDGQDGNMYLYVGKKNENGGREIKIGIKRDKYFEEVEGIEGNRKCGGEGFYNAGESLEISWDLMLITIDFAGWPLKFKERKNNNQPVPTIIKEKLLRNLDKICLDPLGDLANAELLKDKEIERKYYWNPNYNLSEHKKIAAKVYKVEIEGEEINLEKAAYSGSDIYYELKRALIQEIKANPTQWKIVPGEKTGYEGTPGYSNNFLTVRHHSGRRNWKFGINRLWTGYGHEREKYWAEIEALLNETSLPINNQKSKINDTEKSQLLNYFQKYNIQKITLQNGKLVIEYNNHKETIENENSEQQKCHQLIQNLPGQSLSLNELQKDNNSATPDKSKAGIYIGLTIGGVVLGGLALVLFFRRKKKSPKN